MIRHTDSSLGVLAQGADLTSLGLNLNSAEPLYSTFGSPWAEVPCTRDPQFTVPACYAMSPAELKTGHLEKFQLETLFYIFYAMPKDQLQGFAAQELYNRKWKYHKEKKMWFSGQPDLLKSQGAPSDGLIAFDAHRWQRHVVQGPLAQSLMGSFLSEEEVRMTPP